MEKEIKTASGGPVEEFLSMEVGETRRFPFSRYNDNTLRALPARLWVQRSEGRKWVGKANYIKGYREVTRVS